ncbi:MAG: prolyl oligopeptidase family serine peptidase [bacterium]|nr:prolyl oligopeptidase family serine peptidase [bacterium]
MIVYRLKSKNIVYDLYLPEQDNGKVVLYVPGLPGHPRKSKLGETFAVNDFTFFEMRFPGTWESDGKFSMDACVGSLEEAYAFIRNVSAVELRREVEKKWTCDEVIFMGSSFGGGVVLSSKIKDPLTFILMAPVTSFGTLKNSLMPLSSGEDDLFHLLKEGYANVYRGLTKKDWQNFLNGKTLINPEANLENLKNKKLIFVQGSSDTVIKSDDTDEFVKKLEIAGVQPKLIMVPGAGHGGDLEDKAVDALVRELKSQ